MKLGIGLVAILLASQMTEAKVFQNTYVSFEVPDTWTCLQEGVAWSCNPKDAQQAREAVIVLVAKVSGPEDNLTTYLNLLKAPRKLTTKVGTPMPSQVMYAQQRTLGGQNWVQAQHLGSEIQDFYTLYLVTVQNQIAINVTFSSEKSKYQQYNPIFDQAIKTIKIIANQKMLFPHGEKAGANESIGIQVPAPNNQVQAENFMPPPEKPASGGGLWIFIGALLVAAVGTYIFLTKRKKNSHSKTPSKSRK